MKLKQQDVRDLKPSKRYADGNNLYLWVRSKAYKKWTFRYTLNGEAHEHIVGDANTMKLKEARKIAADYREQLSRKVDPFQPPKATEVPTFKEAAQDYIGRVSTKWRSPKTKANWESTLDDKCYPVIGDIPCDQIKRSDVIHILTPLFKDQFPTAHKLRGRIENIIASGTSNMEAPPVNPARWKGNLDKEYPSKGDHEPKHIKALDYEQAPEFISILKKREGAAAKALIWSILTVMRSGSVRKMKWQDVDFKNGIWTCLRSDMKERNKVRIPLTPKMIALLGAKRPSHHYVFSNGDNKILSENALRNVMVRTGWINAGRPHGFRSTFSNWAWNKMGYPADLINEYLQHTKDEVFAAYVREDMLEKRREVMLQWEKYLKF